MSKSNPDILQGTLDLLVLQTLALGPNHGWAIAQRIRQVSRDVSRDMHGSLAGQGLEQSRSIELRPAVRDEPRVEDFERPQLPSGAVQQIQARIRGGTERGPGCAPPVDGGGEGTLIPQLERDGHGDHDAEHDVPSLIPGIGSQEERLER